ncbi:hypothetical protein CRYUN_Cryun32bG0010300 [Craigia yunnanensis]
MRSLIGRVVKVDRNIEEAIKGRFARLCVVIDLSKPLVSKIMVEKYLSIGGV